MGVHLLPRKKSCRTCGCPTPKKHFEPWSTPLCHLAWSTLMTIGPNKLQLPGHLMSCCFEKQKPHLCSSSTAALQMTLTWPATFAGNSIQRCCFHFVKQTLCWLQLDSNNCFWCFLVQTFLKWSCSSGRCAAGQTLTTSCSATPPLFCLTMPHGRLVSWGFVAMVDATSLCSCPSLAMFFFSFSVLSKEEVSALKRTTSFLPHGLHSRRASSEPNKGNQLAC